MKKWSPGKGLELITRLALRKGVVGVGMEHLVMLLEKQVIVFFEGLPNSGHSSGLLSVCEPWSVREFCKCIGNFWTVWSLGNPGTVLCKPSDIRGI